MRSPPFMTKQAERSKGRGNSVGHIVRQGKHLSIPTSVFQWHGFLLFLTAVCP